jgi:hypothetical protein
VAKALLVTVSLLLRDSGVAFGESLRVAAIPGTVEGRVSWISGRPGRKMPNSFSTEKSYPRSHE